MQQTDWSEWTHSEFPIWGPSHDCPKKCSHEFFCVEPLHKELSFLNSLFENSKKIYKHTTVKRTSWVLPFFSLLAKSFRRSHPLSWQICASWHPLETHKYIYIYITLYEMAHPQRVQWLCQEIMLDITNARNVYTVFKCINIYIYKSEIHICHTYRINQKHTTDHHHFIVVNCLDKVDASQPLGYMLPSPWV